MNVSQVGPLVGCAYINTRSSIMKLTVKCGRGGEGRGELAVFAVGDHSLIQSQIHSLIYDLIHSLVCTSSDTTIVHSQTHSLTQLPNSILHPVGRLSRATSQPPSTEPAFGLYPLRSGVPGAAALGSGKVVDGVRVGVNLSIIASSITTINLFAATSSILSIIAFFSSSTFFTY